MLQQAIDFREECEALYAVIRDLDDDDFKAQTQFKSWTLNDVLRHLHVWNRAADQSLFDQDAFNIYLGKVLTHMQGGEGLPVFEAKELRGLAGVSLREAWRALYLEMGERWQTADPKQRVKWAGPDMSVRSSITARLMETWAHGQEIFDHLGLERKDEDRIKNIAILGINTFGWTYKVRSMPVPETLPRVELSAPSGATWVWNEETTSDVISGHATEFCQVVTQTRNIADTSLTVEGSVATEWMSMAQCFAGGPVAPPAPGSRFRQQK